MILLHHLTSFFGAFLGLTLAFLLINFKVFTWRPFVVFCLMFGLGVFFHVFIFDAYTYQRIDYNGLDAYQKFIIQGQAWGGCSPRDIIGEVLKEHFNINYNEYYNKTEQGGVNE